MRFLFLIFLLLAAPAWSANKFVRAPADCANNGTGANWSCAASGGAAGAYDGLPSSLTRGDTYYLSDGTFTADTLDDSGTTIITIRKCRTDDGVSSAASGYVSTLCDGVGTFNGTIIFAGDGYTIDGAGRTGLASGHGFRADSVAQNTSWTGACASDITISYMELGGPDIGNVVSETVSAGVYLADFAACTNNDWTIEYTYIHNTGYQGAALHMNGIDGCLIQHNYVTNSHGKEAIRGQIYWDNCVVRYNIFKDSCQNDGEVGSGCTAEIASWDGSSFSGNEVYGNVFWKTTSEENSGGVIVIGGNGAGWVGPSGSNNLVYHNTIAGIEGGSSGGLILLNGGTGNVCRNNLWYDVVGSPSCNANTTSNNTEVGSDPFVDYTGGDFHLTANTTAGFSGLGSPYNVDMDGVTRSNPDLGAFEYDDGGTPDPSYSSHRRSFHIHSWLLMLGLLGGVLYALGRTWRRRRNDSVPGAARVGRVGRSESARA